MSDLILSLLGPKTGLSVRQQQVVYCVNCRGLTVAGQDNCAHCGYDIRSEKPDTFLKRLLRLFGFGQKDTLTLLRLDEPALAPPRFFSDEEVDALLTLSEARVLNPWETPGFDQMFYKSKRISRPSRRVSLRLKA